MGATCPGSTKGHLRVALDIPWPSWHPVHMHTTSYIRYSQVQPGDSVKLTNDGIWRDRRVAERYDAPFLVVDAITDHSPTTVAIAAGGATYLKPKTSKALVLA